jgi:hypothetical protein
LHEILIIRYESGAKGSGHITDLLNRIIDLDLESQGLGLTSSGLGIDVTDLARITAANKS